MKTSDMHPSRFMRADDLPETGLVATMMGVVMEPIKGMDGKEKSKPILSFVEAGVKPLVLNVTNTNTIEHLYGDDSDDWQGQRITLTVVDVDSPNGRVPGIRVSTRKPIATRPGPAKTPAVQTLAGDEPPVPDEPPDEDWN